MTSSPYSHVGIAFSVTIGGVKRTLVIEAQGGTSRRIISLDFYNNTEFHVVKSPVPFESYSFIALQQVGIQSYSYWDAFVVGLRERLRKTFGIYIIPQGNAKGEICSEFVARMLNVNPSSLSPQGLFAQISKPIEYIIKD